MGERCSTIAVDGEDKPITQEWKEAFQKAISELAGMGCRVIGFCDLMLPAAKYPPGFSFDPDNIDIPLQDMRFVGLMSIIDPPKAAAPDTIMGLRRRYETKVMMITGDHPVTALAIAQSIGLVSMNSKTNLRNGFDVEDVDTKDAEALVITGEQLRKLSQSKLMEIMENCGEIVFARINPDQRISIVEACRGLGLRVAVTGWKKDDIPSLKMADVGIVFEWDADQEAKEAADIRLLDNNIGSISYAIGLGKNFVASFDSDKSQDVQE